MIIVKEGVRLVILGCRNAQEREMMAANPTGMTIALRRGIGEGRRACNGGSASKSIYLRWRRRHYFMLVYDFLCFRLSTNWMYSS